MHRFNAIFLFQSIDGISTEIARIFFDFEVQSLEFVFSSYIIM